MQGKLIVFEGTDGSGKSTQFRMLCERMEREGRPFRRLIFPQYQEPSSALLKMYLNGEFGSHPSDVNPYAASTFYAVDRYASYKKDWGGDYEGDKVILADRYTTSNAVHQGSKLEGGEREAYLTWLFDFEYRLMGLPEPDLVLYLDVPIEQTEKNMRRREILTSTSGDIHEKDEAYLKACRVAALEAAERFGWKRIPCVKDGEMRSIEEIHQDIYQAVKEIL